MLQKQKKAIQEFLKHYRQGDICVHPTDTLPGLTILPTSENLTRLHLFKGRDSEKHFVFLVSSVDRALSFFAELPKGWEQKLRIFWPDSLTVVFQARAKIPREWLGPEDTIAIRVPRWPEEFSVMEKILEELESPMPTTSINLCGQKPLYHAEEIRIFAKDLYTPEFSFTTEALSLPSTLLKINPDGSYKILRQGRFYVS